MNSKKRIGIVGAGISGLICAYELQKHGYEVKVFEKESNPGGRVATFFQDGFKVDLGAQTYLNTFSSTIQYCRELKIDHLLKPITTSVNALYYKSKVHGVTFTDISFSNLIKLLKVFNFSCFRLSKALLTWIKRSKNLNFFDIKKDNLLEMNAYDYLSKTVGREIFDLYLAPAFLGVNFYSPKEVNVNVFFSYLKFLHDSVVYYNFEHLGIMGLPQVLSRNLQIKYSTPIKKIISQQHSVQVQENEIEYFDKLVLAVTAPNALAIYANPTSNELDFLQSVRYGSSINVSYCVPAQYFQKFNSVFFSPADSVIIASLVVEGAKDHSYIINDKCIISILLHHNFANEIMDCLDDKIFNIIKEEFLRLFSFLHKDTIKPFFLKRWPQAIPIISPQLVSKIDQFWNNDQGKNNVFLCGDYLVSPYIEGSVRCGKRVADKIIQALN